MKSKGSYIIFTMWVSALTLLVAVASCGGGGGGGSALVKACGPTFAVPNYAEETDSVSGDANVIVWWREFPIKVWFDEPVVFDFGGTLVSSVDVLQASFSRWGGVTGGRVYFEYVTDESEAQIKVYQKLLPAQGEYLGFATVDGNEETREVTEAEITINFWQGMNILHFVNTMSVTGAHEMGHVIFIQGHSNTESDLMFQGGELLVDKAISQQDTNTLWTAYCGEFPQRSATPQFGDITESNWHSTIECGWTDFKLDPMSAAMNGATGGSLFKMSNTADGLSQ